MIRVATSRSLGATHDQDVGRSKANVEARVAVASHAIAAETAAETAAAEDAAGVAGAVS